MIRPRQYLSFSQMTTFEMSPEKYADEYIYGKKRRTSRNMAYGSLLAEGLEKDEATGDPVLDIMASKISKLDRADKHVEDKNGIEIEWTRHGKTQLVWIPVLQDKKEKIPILAIPDSAREDYSEIYEYKSSTRKWTQKMADNSGQITFYATAIWLMCGKIPQNIELINLPVTYKSDGSIEPTGEIIRFKTKRTMVDIIKMTNRMKKAWSGIKELCEKELL